MVKHEGAQIAINGAVPAAPRYYASRPSRATVAYATTGMPHRHLRYPVYASDDQGFYLRPALGYTPQPRGLGEWLMDPGGW